MLTTPTPEKPIGGRLIRVTWSVADQALSSLMGLGLSVVVAHVVSPTAFGAFAVALAVYYVGLGCSRALTSDVFLVRFSHGQESRVRDARAQATGTALITGITLGLFTGGASLLVAGEIGRTLIAISIVFPFLFLQDFMRYAFFAARLGRLAFGVDVLWVCSAGALVASTLTLGVHDAAVFTTEWGIGAGVAALVALKVANVVPRPDRTVAWLRSQQDLATRFLAEVTLMAGVGSLALILVGSIAGLQAAGSLRGATVLLGPLTVLLMASTMIGVPEGVSARGHSASALRVLAFQISALLTITAVLWTTAMTLLPSPLGERILGDSWAGAHEVVLPMGVAACAVGAMSGAFIGLRALAAARQSLRVRMITAPLILGATLVGTFVHGALGAATGMAIANCVLVIVAWRSFGTTLNLRPRGEVVASPPCRSADLTDSGLSA